MPSTESVRFAVLGAGGHAREVAWIATDIAGPDAVACFVDHDLSPLIGRTLAGRPVLRMQDLAGSGLAVCPAVGDPHIRERMMLEAASFGLAAAPVVHPSAIVAPTARLGEGIVVFPRVVISVDTEIGQHTHLNTAASIHHDVRIGRYVTVSPGAHLCGNTAVEDFAYVGAGAVVAPGHPERPLTVGRGAMIGAQSCVVRDIPPAVVACGVPARPLTRRSGAAELAPLPEWTLSSDE
jgi:sugar O-acyltransferase (sialic acid O-acetyltransferase NeuD family)